MIYVSYMAGFVYICSTSTLPETQKMNFSYKVKAHWRQKKTHKTLTTMNPLWPIPNAPKTHDHTIWDPLETHGHTICNPQNLTWDPRPHHQARPNAPPYPWTHNTNLECQCRTHPPIWPPQSSNPYHNQQNPPTIPKPSNHESDLTSWPWVRPTNLISPLNHNLRTTKHKQRHRRERREKREEREGRRVYVCYCVLWVCDLVND